MTTLKYGVASLGLLLIGGLSAYASEDRNQTTLEALTITATQNPNLQVLDAPVPVTVLSDDAIKQQTIMNVTDFFNKTPGVDALALGQGSVQPVIRGLSQEQVLVMVDGIRLSDERPGGNHILSIDPAQIERVEIVRGPGSVLYGAGAIGGVINFITKKAPQTDGESPRYGGEIGLQYHSNGEGFKQTAHLYTGAGSFNVYAGGTHKNSNNMESPNEEIQYSFYDGYSIWGGGNYVSDAWTAEANLWQNVADIGIPTARTFLADYYDNETHSMINSKIAYRGEQNWMEEFSIAASWQEHNRHRIRKPNATGLVDIQVDKETATLRAQLVATPVASHRITAGIDLFDESLDSTRAIKNLPASAGFDGIPVMAPSSRTGIGLFAQDEIFSIETVNVTAGIRYDTIEAETDGASAPYFITEPESDRDSALSGSLGLLVAIAPDTNLFANAGRAFRAPTIIERYFYGPHDGPGQDIGNPDLDPEKSWNFDVGFRRSTDTYQFSVSLFYTKVDDMIRKILQNPEDAAEDQIYLYENISEATLYGAEVEGEYALNRALKLFGWLSWVRGEDETADQPLTDIPPVKTRYGLHYDGSMGLGDYWLEASGLTALRQNRAGSGEKETPGYTTADLRAGLQTPGGLQLTVAAENLFDRTTYDHLSYAWQSLDYAMPGRNVKCELSYTF